MQSQKFTDPAGVVTESPTVVLFNTYAQVLGIMKISPEAAMWTMAVTVLGYHKIKTGQPFVVHEPDCTCEEDER